MAKLVALMGIPACGKSTYVEARLEVTPDAVVICPDTIREELTGDIADQTQNEKVFELAFVRAHDALHSGKDVIWDATNVSQRARQGLLKMAVERGVSAKLVILDVPLSIAKLRNSRRERVVPEHVLERMYGQFQQSLSQIGYENWQIIERHPWG